MNILPPEIQAVYFDAVGTVIYPATSAPTMYAEVAAEFGLDVSAAVVRERFIAAFREEEAMDLANDWQTSETREVERWVRIVEQSLLNTTDPEACFRKLYDHFGKPNAWNLDPSLEPLLSSLQARGVRFGLASNYDHRLRSVVAGHATMTRFMPNIVISSEVGYRKPSENFFRRIFQQLPGVKAAEIGYIGDDLENDYHGATAAGMLAILLDPEGRHPNIPRRIHTLAELMVAER
jgi:putative hydrolase of the HAD superfamily